MGRLIQYFPWFYLPSPSLVAVARSRSEQFVNCGIGQGLRDICHLELFKNIASVELDGINRLA
jgi:hypothetical protein